MTGARRKKGEDSIFFETSRNAWRCDINPPQGKTITLRDKDQAGLLRKREQVKKDLAAQIRTPASYTVGQCVRDFLDYVTEEGERAPGTLRKNTSLWNVHLSPGTAIGDKRIAELLGRDIREALKEMRPDLATRTLQGILQLIRMALRHGLVEGLVRPEIVSSANELSAPSGMAPGRPSKSLTLEQAVTLLEMSRDHWLWPYVALCLLGGVRTEEARGLMWDAVDLRDDNGIVYVVRSDRVGGVTKTRQSRRGLELARLVTEALRDLRLSQARQRAEAGSAWQEHGLVFCHADGTPYTDRQVREPFAKLCASAGLGANWTPRETRHTFASILDDAGISRREIADALGHSTTQTLETTYRHVIRPVLTSAAKAMDGIFPGQTAR